MIARLEPAATVRDDARARVRRPARPPAHARAARTRRRSRAAPAAAAAGGYCAILAMPNTDPVVDSAAVLRGLLARARDEAVVPTGFLAAISKGQHGEELAELGELADAGAAGFTDDGRPVASSGAACGARSSTAPSTAGRSRCTARSRRSRGDGQPARGRASPPSWASPAGRRSPRA